MAAPVVPALPAGFVLDEDTPPLPEGFTLDAAAPPAVPVEVPPAGMADRVPLPGGESVDEQGRTYPAPEAAPPAAEPSLWERVKGAVQGDPIIDMWLQSLGTAVKGAPETAGGVLQNTLATIGGGLGSAIEGPDYVEDMQNQFGYTPQGDSAKQLTAGLAEAMNLAPAKRALGDATLEATGSPLAATGADLLPDLGMMMLGGPKATEGAVNLRNTPLKADPVVNPKVAELRASDIRMRPSDVRAMTPGAKKVSGEFREKFADAPQLKTDMTLHNQTRYTDLAAKEIGAKLLDDASIAKAKEAPSGTYDTVEGVLMDRPMSQEFQDVFREAAASAKLPKGEKSSVTRIIGALRRRAAKRMQNDQVATEEAGFADRELAERLEEQMGAELEAAGEGQLLGEYQAARQEFAKIHDVETATRAGQIDANMVYKLKKRGVPLTGGLATIADAAEFAPNVSQHSLKTAARAGDEIESSREGLMKRGVKAAVRKIPGMDVGAESFQRTMGLPDEARASYAGQAPFKDTPRVPEQNNLDLAEQLNLEAPEGVIGDAPRPREVSDQMDAFGGALDLEPPGRVGSLPRRQRDLGPQVDALGEAFEFDRPPGEVGVPPEAQVSLQELLGLGEPLTMKQPPGRVGKPKRKS